MEKVIDHITDYLAVTPKSDKVDLTKDDFELIYTFIK